MTLVVRITSGARAGSREEFSGAVVVAGRHPASELRFDAQNDLDVSTRHAEFRSEGDRWTVRDLGSTNGTFVNGARIATVTPIAAGDVVTFGDAGPRVEIVTAGASTEAAAPRTVQRSSQGIARPKTEERIAVAVAKETHTLRRFVMGLAAVVVIGVGALVWMNQRSAAQSNAAIMALLARSDSLSAALRQTQLSAMGREAGLDSMVRLLQQQRDALSQKLRSGGDVSAISNQMTALDKRTAQALSLAGTNYRAVADANGKAVAYVIVKDVAGRAFTGTAFGITPGGMLVTNRHVVLDDQGRPPQKMYVYFSETEEHHPAHVVRTSPDHDLALIQIEDKGTFPTVRGIVSSASIGAGDPIALIGYPLGTEVPQGGPMKTATFTAGFVSKVIPDTIQINAFAAEGSSGSPLFNAQGNVTGILFGAVRDTEGKLILCIPSSALIAFLKPEERTVAR